MKNHKMTNIHDYLYAIGAKPPPIDEKKLSEAKKNMIIVHSIEEAVEALETLDTLDTSRIEQARTNG